MKNEIIIDGVVYVKKEIEEPKKIVDEIKYNNFEWFIINEDENSYTLLLKDVLEEEIVKEMFEKYDLLDEDCDVIFSKNIKNNNWKDSMIRFILNTEFYNKFNKSDLLEMKTILNFNNKEEKESVDLVRLIAEEEVELLDKKILKSSKMNWTMSPGFFDGSNAYEWSVGTNGSLNNYYYVTFGYALRPVIRVRKGAIN